MSLKQHILDRVEGNKEAYMVIDSTGNGDYILVSKPDGTSPRLIPSKWGTGGSEQPVSVEAFELVKASRYLMVWRNEKMDGNITGWSENVLHAQTEPLVYWRHVQ